MDKQKVTLRENKSSSAKVFSKSLLEDIRGLIDSIRNRVAHVVNTGLVLLYWQIGERIRREILKEKRAEYGEEIFQTVSGKLSSMYGRGILRAIFLIWYGWQRLSQTLMLPWSFQSTWDGAIS